MTSVKKDFYRLGQSDQQSLTGLGQEIRIDLHLTPNPALKGGTISGTVKDSNQIPIPGAVIKIMDKEYNPLAHTISSADGTYVFSAFPAATGYRIFCSAVGYTLATLDQFTLLEEQIIKKDFSLVKDVSLTKSFIAGDVYGLNKSPVAGAVVEIYTTEEDATETLVSTVFTNEFGQYVFRELEQANYTISISALSYQSSTSTVSITAPSTIIKVETTLNIDINASKGTVSGIITDEDNQPIVGADVILYKVEADQSLTPVALTKTIAGGVYLFVNTLQGDYKIKSSKTVTD